jgi:hypothetical protein
VHGPLKTLLASQEPELAAAIRAGAQAKVNQLKAELTNQIANRVTSQLNRSFSFYDDWFDPVIGLRWRFNLRVFEADGNQMLMRRGNQRDSQAAGDVADQRVHAGSGAGGVSPAPSRTVFGRQSSGHRRSPIRR